MPWGKDSAGNPTEGFPIKTKQDGNVIPDVDHTVEEVLLIDGKPLKLKRRYREVYTKKRHILKGHQTDYWIDDEPITKQKDYNAYIASNLVDIDIFKLLSSVTHFYSLDWKKRRQKLFQLCSGLSEKSLREAEKRKKIIAEKIKDFEKAKKEIRPRIDERFSALKALANLNREEVQTKIDDLEKQISTAKTGSQRSALLKERSDLKAELSRLRAEQGEKKQKIINEIRAEINEIEDDYVNTKRIIRQIEHEIATKEEIIRLAGEEIEKLRSDFYEVSGQEPDVANACYACGRPFEEDQIESARAEFNRQKSKKLEEINHLGKFTKEKKEKAEAEKAKLEDELKLEQADLAKIEETLSKKQAKLKDIIYSADDSSLEDNEIERIKDKIYDLTGLIEAEDLRVDISALEYTLDKERAKLAKLDAGKEHQARIEELKQEEKFLASKIEELEAEREKAEEEIEAQARAVEEEVNKKFEYATFQLFEPHLNESITPCCKILTRDTKAEWGHGASYSETVNLGLDIIRTFQKHYGIKIVVFIDNCESVTSPIDPGCQIIKLVKDERCQELEVKCVN